MWVKIETERLMYIKNNQIKLRVENYIHLRDSILEDGDIESIGQLFILPSSYVGSPR